MLRTFRRAALLGLLLVANIGTLVFFLLTEEQAIVAGPSYLLRLDHALGRLAFTLSTFAASLILVACLQALDHCVELSRRPPPRSELNQQLRLPLQPHHSFYEVADREARAISQRDKLHHSPSSAEGNDWRKGSTWKLPWRAAISGLLSPRGSQSSVDRKSCLQVRKKGQGGKPVDACCSPGAFALHRRFSRRRPRSTR